MGLEKVKILLPLRCLNVIHNTYPFIDLSPAVRKRLDNFFAPPELWAEPLDIPDFRGTLHGFQNAGVRRLIQYPHFALNDGMGLGKTYMVTAGLVYLHALPALVMCPNSAKWVWEDCVRENTDLDIQVVDGTAGQRGAQIERMADITVVNWEIVRLHPELAEIEYEAAVADEVHRAGNPEAQVTQAFLSITKPPIKWPMSGTQFLNDPLELWPALNWTYPERYPSYWSFKRWLTVQSKGKKKFVIGYNPRAVVKLRDFIHQDDVAIRRRQEQISDQLPKQQPSTIYIELTKEQRKLYDQIAKEFRMKLDTGEIRSIRSVRAQVTRLRQACFSPELYGGSHVSAKMAEIKQVAKALAEEGHKLLLGSAMSKATRIMQRELSFLNPAYVDGSVKGSLRREEARKFNHDEDCHLYIGTIRANQEAINLGVATYVGFSDKEWAPARNDQFIGRSAAGGLRGAQHGPGTSVIVMEFVAKDTIEERIEAVLGRKRALFNHFIEGDGGAVVERLTVSDFRDLI